MVIPNCYPFESSHRHEHIASEKPAGETSSSTSLYTAIHACTALSIAISFNPFI
jgi:hypothetical protein